MKLFPLLLALQGGACLVFAEAFKDVSNLATLEHYNIDWIDCETFFDHFDTLARAARLPPIKSSKSYSPMVCEKVFQHYKSNPATVDALVNLANHVEKKLNGDGRRLSKRDKVEDIASHLRGTHAKQQLTTLLYKSKTPADFERRLQTAGEDFLAFDAENSGAMEIPICNDTNVANDECPHAPCVPQYLFNNNVDTFYEFIPAYGGSFGYKIGTALVKEPLLTLLGPIRSNFAVIFQAASGIDIDTGTEILWTGDPADRTDTGNVGFLLVLLFAQGTANTILESVCDVSPDDIEVPLVCVDLPNPLKVICEATELVLKFTGQILSDLEAQAAFQDSLVDGAEVEAAYEIGRNILQKSCAIYDAAVCRCQDEDNPAGTFGKGCDGLDSDCDDVIDECDEDTVLPTLYVTDAFAACSDPWFLTPQEAEDCVKETVVAADDCQTTTETFLTENQCGESTVAINTTDACGNGPVSAIIPVKIDIAAPTVSCSFSVPSITTTGPSVLEDLGFTYSASDNCGGPLNVTASIFSSEIENFNAQELALFYQDGLANERAKLYLAKGICSTSSNGQCIKDPKAPLARKYTAVVEATDESGQTSVSECSVSIIPQGGGTGGGGNGRGRIGGRGNNVNPSTNGGADTTTSTQRFFLTSYSSIFVEYSS
jgi:hypothetical protein